MRQALCIAPSRELARQIMTVVTDMGKFTPVTTAYAIKDSVSHGTTLRQHIVVGTPGTLTDLIRKRSIDPKQIKIFVVDEADNMLDQQGLGDQTLRVKKYALYLWGISSQLIVVSVSFPVIVRLYSFPRHFPTTCETSPTNSLPKRTRSASGRRNCP